MHRFFAVCLVMVRFGVAGLVKAGEQCVVSSCQVESCYGTLGLVMASQGKDV